MEVRNNVQADGNVISVEDKGKAVKEAVEKWPPAQLTGLTDALRAENTHLLDRIKKLEVVVSAVRLDMNRVATMPWCRDNHESPRYTCVVDTVWKEWIYGTHDQVYAALAALDAGKETE